MTKEFSHWKPNYLAIWNNLNSQVHLLRLNIAKLTIPKLSCGLDVRMNIWEKGWYVDITLKPGLAEYLFTT